MLSWSHFPQYKERISGIVVGGFGLGSAVFNFVATSLVNPDNESPSIQEDEGGVSYHYFDRHIAENVPKMLRWLAFIYLLVSTLAVLLMTLPAEAEVKTNGEVSAPSVIAAIKTPQFLHMFVASLCSVCKR